MTPRATVAGWALAVLLIGWSGPVVAQEVLKARLSLSYQSAPVATVLHALANVIGARLQLDPRVVGSVTLELRGVSAETVLRAVCEGTGCRWRLEQARLIVEPDPAAGSKPQPDPYAGVKIADVHQDIPAHIVWNAAPLDAVAGILAGMLEAELILDPALGGRRVSLDQNGGSMWSVINSICEQAGCRWRFSAEVKRRLLLVSEGPASLYAEIPADIRRAGTAGVVAPKVLSASRPRYTDAARKAGWSGVVTVECVVLPDGTVGQVRVDKSIDQTRELDKEAAMAARLYLFTPGTFNGVPVPVVVIISFTFTNR